LIYVVEGRDDDGEPTNTAEVFSTITITGRWEMVNPVKVARDVV